MEKPTIGKHECSLTHDVGAVPHFENDAAWENIIETHGETCAWAASRAYMVSGTGGKCFYCESPISMYPHKEAIPDALDDYAWAAFATQHKSDCNWLLFRNGAKLVCACCHSMIDAVSHPPTDDEAWKKIREQHKPGCELASTRYYQVAGEGNCFFCGVKLRLTTIIPDAEDHYGWDTLQEEHKKDCFWFTIRRKWLSERVVCSVCRKSLLQEHDPDCAFIYRYF